MSNPPIRPLALILTCTGLLACSSGDAPTNLTDDGCAVHPAQTLVDRINDFRAAQDLEPLVVDVRLARASQDHARDMADHDFFERIGSDGSSVEDRVRNQGFEPLFITENLGAGHATADEIFQAWAESPSHEAALLAQPATHIGVGRADNPEAQFRVYWSMTVASTEAPPQEPVDGCHPQ